MALLLAAALAGPVWAEGPSLEAPALGYAFDLAAGAIRPVLGVPGAAWFGAPLQAAEAIPEATTAPWRDYALAPGQDGLRILRWNAGNIVSRKLDGSAVPPEKIVFSPSGSAVAIAGAGRIEVWTGMPDDPAPSLRFERAGPIAALAVADGGGEVALAQDGAVYRIGAGGPRLIAEGGRIAGLAYARRSSNLAIADADRGKVSVSGTGFEIDAADPASVAFSADGRRLAVASAALSTAILIDLTTREASSVSCECRVETLTPVRGNAVFRLTQDAKGRAPILDGDGAELRIVFIAAGEESR